MRLNVYREVVPFGRLVFTWGASGDDPEDFLVITVTLEPDGEHTRMAFDLRGLVRPRATRTSMTAGASVGPVG